MDDLLAARAGVRSFRSSVKVITSGTGALIRITGGRLALVLFDGALRGPPASRHGVTLRTVDAVDNEIRFTTEWGGRTRYVFIPDPYVSNDAGRRVTRDEAIDYVRANLGRYRAEARAQHGDESAEKIVIIARDDPDQATLHRRSAS